MTQNALKKFLKDLNIKDLDEEINQLNELTNEDYVFPNIETRFRAFELTPVSEVKVVILGQDPYHGKGQANGLSFAVNRDITVPPSLKNIYKELYNDIGVKIPSHGDLTAWAKQGVLLLNSVLTVEEGKPGSNFGMGWEKITDTVIHELSKRGNIVFVLWGKKAQEKIDLIDSTENLILMSSHPSPYSADQGFFKSKPFSKINKFLKEIGRKHINWEISE